jgi:predicted Zn-dependent protease
MIDLALTTDGADAAVKKAQAAQAALPDKLDGSLVMADTLRAAKKLTEAEALYKSVWKARPTVPLLGAYTQTLDAQGKFAQARTVIGDWLKTHPKDGTARFLMVVSSINLGQYPNALSEGQALLKDRPKDVALLNNVAWLHDKTGNPAKAIEMAEAALAQAPNSAEIKDTLGWLLVRNNKVDRGLALLKAAHEASPNTPDIAYHYAFALKQTGKSGDAKGVMTLALKSSQPFADRKDAEKFMQTLP